jgi:protease-4
MIGAFLVLLAVMSATGGMEDITAGGERIALIRIDGMIVAGQSGFSFLGGAATGSDDVVRQIERATEDSEVKGILLRINSPGGSAAGSQEIYRAVQRARTSRKEPLVVVASMADVAASGGYYVAAAADRIFADPATLTGSIGAIAMHQDMSGLLSKIGVKSEVIKSGDLKDMLHPAAPLTDEARAVVRTLVEQVHEQFIQDVIEGRQMEEETVRQLADGCIYSGQQAKENGLVDELGGMQAALEEAGELAGIKGKPRLKEERPPTLLRWLMESSSSSARRPIAVTGGLLYDDFAAQLAQGALGPQHRAGEM